MKGRFLLVCFKCMLFLSRTEINVKLPITSHQNTARFNALQGKHLLLSSSPWPWLNFIGGLCDVQMEVYDREFTFNKMTSIDRKEIKGGFCFSGVDLWRASEDSLLELERKDDLVKSLILIKDQRRYH